MVCWPYGVPHDVIIYNQNNPVAICISFCWCFTVTSLNQIFIMLPWCNHGISMKTSTYVFLSDTVQMRPIHSKVIHDVVCVSVSLCLFHVCSNDDISLINVWSWTGIWSNDGTFFNKEWWGGAWAPEAPPPPTGLQSRHYDDLGFQCLIPTRLRYF